MRIREFHDEGKTGSRGRSENGVRLLIFRVAGR